MLSIIHSKMLRNVLQKIKGLLNSLVSRIAQQNQNYCFQLISWWHKTWSKRQYPRLLFIIFRCNILRKEIILLVLDFFLSRKCQLGVNKITFFASTQNVPLDKYNAVSTNLPKLLRPHSKKMQIFLQKYFI